MFGLAPGRGGGLGAGEGGLGESLTHTADVQPMPPGRGTVMVQRLKGRRSEACQNWQWWGGWKSETETRT